MPSADDQKPPLGCVNVGLYVIYIALIVPGLSALGHQNGRVAGALVFAAVAVTVVEHLVTKYVLDSRRARR